MRIFIFLFFISFIIANDLNNDLITLDSKIKNNPWITKYKNYNEYNAVRNEKLDLESQIKELKELPQNTDSRNKLNLLEQKYDLVQKQEELLHNYKDEPYKELAQTQSSNEIPKITNPFLIPNGLSYIKDLKAQLKAIEDNFNDLENLLLILNKKAQILSKQNKKTELQDTENIINELDSIKNILNLYINIFKKDSQNNINKVRQEIKEESLKLLYITIAIAIISLISFIIKFILKIYAQRGENNKSYTINKVINVFNISIIVLILLFAYIENVTYIVAIIGFVSAGLAIAMKDWFMSFFGYMVIMGGGSIKQGDRIRVVKDNIIYVGDVIDISMLRITLYEDVTYTTYNENRRAGRIIFIPNNLIFTTMIANYSHSNMKTVWDGVDITITFKSNYKKALKLASNIAKKYSSGYTETTRRQLNMLKVQYSLRDMNVEPRVFSFVVPNGIKISIWFQTNAYATLMLNSLISGEIVEIFNKEDDIEISYPTTTIIPKGDFKNIDYLSQNKILPKENFLNEENKQ
ncbi:MAG: mechanosensitive ion channel [Helicobacteraceae bacterium]|nr:mechanosensitive ion channel [Helicobacteraceae bacterium]